MAAQALDRAEVLKKSLQQQKVVKPQQQQAQQQAIRPAFDLLHIDEAASAKSSSGPGKASVGLTDEEKKVLAVTSSINSREYLPFTSGDLREKSDLSPLTSDSTSQDVQPVGGGATGVTNVDMNEDTNVSNVKLLQL